MAPEHARNPHPGEGRGSEEAPSVPPWASGPASEQPKPTMPTHPVLATCSVREYRRTMGIPAPVCTAADGIIPKSFPLPRLYPDSGLHETMTQRNHADLYRRQLDRLTFADARVLFDVVHVRSMQYGAPVVLLCTCWLGDPYAVCHRTMIADWWSHKTGQPVPELGVTAVSLFEMEDLPTPIRHMSDTLRT